MRLRGIKVKDITTLLESVKIKLKGKCPKCEKAALELWVVEVCKHCRKEKKKK